MVLDETMATRAFEDNHPELFRTKICHKEPCRKALLRGAEEIADFIIRNYSGRVVEVGAGHRVDVSLLLMRRSDLEVVITDKEERCLSCLSVKKDDIFSPRPDLYKGASLLYSIRPPLELQLAIGMLARRLSADVLIRPLADEIAELPGFSRSLFNVGEARFYLFKPSSKLPE